MLKSLPRERETETERETENYKLPLIISLSHVLLSTGFPEGDLPSWSSFPYFPTHTQTTAVWLCMLPPTHDCQVLRPFFSPSLTRPLWGIQQLTTPFSQLPQPTFCLWNSSLPCFWSCLFLNPVLLGLLRGLPFLPLFLNIGFSQPSFHSSDSLQRFTFTYMVLFTLYRTPTTTCNSQPSPLS